jgi:beta-glucanase (GH16 family)
LAWSDEFDGSKLDTNKWKYWLPGKRRDALNVADAVSVRDGCLFITTYTSNGLHCTGMISTEGRFTPRFGYIEARLAFNESPGMWSAFWLQAPHMGRPPGNPEQAGAEIDICEHRRQDELGDLNGKVQTNIHWDGYGPHSHSVGSGSYGEGLGAGFHVYGFLWTSTNYQFFVDGRWRFTTAAGHSQRPEFLILSSEVDNTSTHWAGPIPAEGYGSRTASKTRLAVDYVRCYAPPGL